MKKIVFLFILLFSILYSRDINYYIFNNNFDYKEYSNGNVIDKESTKIGDLIGIGLEYTSIINSYEGKVILEYSRGKTKYDGATWSGTPLSLTHNNVYIFNVKYLLKNIKYPFYIGLGYRLWDRGNSDYSGDYNEKYYWPYLIIGFNKRINFSNFYINPKISYKRAFNPKMKAYLGSGYIYNLGKTDGYTIKLPLFFKINSITKINIFYEYNYWHINPSNIVYIKELGTNTYEPESKTKSQKLGIGIDLLF